VYNINKGRNSEILSRSKTLDAYSGFVDKVREFGNNKTLDDGCRLTAAVMTAAVKWCIEHDVLKKFLEANASEVVNMLLGEWNLEDCVRVRAREAREEGIEEGLERTARNALKEGFPIEAVQRITGLDTRTIAGFSAT
jgi:hypothetical protein